MAPAGHLTDTRTAQARCHHAPPSRTMALEETPESRTCLLWNFLVCLSVSPAIQTEAYDGLLRVTRGTRREGCMILEPTVTEFRPLAPEARLIGQSSSAYSCAESCKPLPAVRTQAASTEGLPSLDRTVWTTLLDRTPLPPWEAPLPKQPQGGKATEIGVGVLVGLSWNLSKG